MSGNNDPYYQPEVPQWVSDILRAEKERNPLAAHGRSRKWSSWKRSYSRKLKYARLNGWTIEEESQ